MTAAKGTSAINGAIKDCNCWHNLWLLQVASVPMVPSYLSGFSSEESDFVTGNHAPNWCQLSYQLEN
jgi:hypothetical protein